MTRFGGYALFFLLGPFLYLEMARNVNGMNNMNTIKEMMKVIRKIKSASGATLAAYKNNGLRPPS
jgi:hypothetical protein